MVIRNLTPDEIATVTQHRSGRTPSLQLIALRQMKPGEGLLLSHTGLKCAAKKCSLQQIIGKPKGETDGAHYKYQHVNGVGSDVMVIRIT